MKYLENLEEPKLQQIQMKICRADLHGAHLQVSFYINHPINQIINLFISYLDFKV